MHPDVTSNEAARCPKCGMKLVPTHLVDRAVGHGHEHASHGDEHTAVPGRPTPASLTATEPPEVTKSPEASSGKTTWSRSTGMTTPANMQWKLRRPGHRGGNTAIDWRFRVGDQVKIRLVNEMAGDHPMHHPFHVHGAGRFLVLSRDGVVEPNLVWKDTVLRAHRARRSTSCWTSPNPGAWMAHCHIAEHHETGMMFNFEVVE